MPSLIMLKGLPGSGKYNVLYVLDDHNQTVQMWRSQGLPCFQVAPGNF